MTSSLFRLSRYTLCLLAVFLFVGTRGRLVAAPLLGNCLEVCDSATDCNTECLYNLDSEETCGDWGTCAPPCSEVCGPTVACDAGCTGGNGECSGYNGGKANNECYGICGDTVCQNGPEDHSSCPGDCPGCSGTDYGECAQASDCGDPTAYYCTACHQCSPISYPPVDETCPQYCTSWADCESSCPSFALPDCINGYCVDDLPPAAPKAMH